MVPLDSTEASSESSEQEQPSASTQTQEQTQRVEDKTPLPPHITPSSDPAQERMAILRMIAEGRITPDEGDLLLEALGNV
ncbi:MAG: hypothetical protein NVSMB49_16750 [Ktedonobacteraceae bacterium]